MVNEGVNVLDFVCNIIDMYLLWYWFDSGIWGVMGIGMGYVIVVVVEIG